MVPKKSKKTSKPAPSTSSEFLDAGVEEEDHGDRWISSGDPAKAVRFYQQACKWYARAIDLDQFGSDVSLDAIYNVARIQFLVYTKVMKTGVLESIAANIEQEIGSSLPAVVSDLSVILGTHELGIQRGQAANGHPALDLLHNYAQVLVEAGEELGSIESFYRAFQVMDEIMQRETAELAALLRNQEDETEPGEILVERDPSEPDSSDESASTSSTTTTPTILLETLVSYLQGLTAFYSTTLEGQISTNTLTDTLFQQTFVKGNELLDKIHQVLSQFGPAAATNISIDQQQTDETTLAIAQYQSTSTIVSTLSSSGALSAATLDPIWTTVSLESRDRYMAQSDAIMELATQLSQSAPEHAWAAYTAASRLLDVGLQRSQGIQAAAVSAQRKLYTAKGDIDYLRSQLQIPVAIKNHSVLLQNAKTFYSNAINLSSLGTTLEDQLIVQEAKRKKVALESRNPQQEWQLAHDS